MTFSGSLQGSLSAAVDVLYSDAVLTRVTNSGASAYDRTGETTTTYPCRAMIEAEARGPAPNSDVEQRRRRVIIRAASLPVTPRAKDRVTVGFPGDAANTFTIVGVPKRDPAGVAFYCETAA